MGVEFKKLVWGLAVGLLPLPALAQEAHQDTDWVFDASKGAAGEARIILEDAQVSFSCTQADQGRRLQDLSYEFTITSEPIVAATGTAPGTLTQIALALDETALGKAPFLHNEAGQLQVSLPHGHALVERFKTAQSAGFSVASEQNTAVLELPMTGFAPVLDQLRDYCIAPGKVMTPELSEFCGASDSAATQQICADAELAALQVQLQQQVVKLSAQLQGKALASFDSQQENWRAQREFCGANRSCLSAAMTGRLSVLTSDEPVQITAQKPEAIVTLSPPPPPLSDAELARVLNEDWMIIARSLIQIAHEYPSVLETETFLKLWYERVMARNQKRPQYNAGQAAQVRNHAVQSINATPPGPFLIGHNASYLFAEQAKVTDQGLRASQTSQKPQSASQLSLRQTGVGTVLNLSDSQILNRFDLRTIPVDWANATILKDAFEQRSVSFNLVIEVSELLPSVHFNDELYSWQSVFQSSDNNLYFKMRGRIRHAGVYRAYPDPSKSKRYGKLPAPQFAAAQRVYAFSPVPATPVQPGLATVAQRLGIRLDDQGRVIEKRLPNSYRTVSNSRRTDCFGLEGLVRFMAIRQTMGEKPSAGEMAMVYHCLATAFERDDVIAPHEQPVLRAAYNGPPSLEFEQRNLDEFRRAELLEQIERRMWKPLMSLVPTEPFEVIVTNNVEREEYDRARGGFPLRSDRLDTLLTDGDYPALVKWPDFLPLSVEQARQLLDYLTQGNHMRFEARYKVNRSGTPELLALELQGVTPEGVPSTITVFDIAPYKGKARPEASPETVAFWRDVQTNPLATHRTAALAALSVASDPMQLAELAIADDARLREANPFDRPGIQADLGQRLVQEAQQNPTGNLTMSGQLSVLVDYVPGQTSYPIQGFSFKLAGDPQDGGARVAKVELENPSALTFLEMDEDTAREMFDFSDKRNSAAARSKQSLDFIAELAPVAGYSTDRGIVLVTRPERIIVKSAQKSPTGYPLAYVEIDKDAFEATPAALLLPQ